MQPQENSRPNVRFLSADGETPSLSETDETKQGDGFTPRTAPENRLRGSIHVLLYMDR